MIIIIMSKMLFLNQHIDYVVLAAPDYTIFMSV